MHTAIRLDAGMFSARIGGEPAAAQDVFPGWERLDRFGLVVDGPLGGVGASLLLQLAVVAFYAADRGRPGHAYPEVYVFHVGAFHGTFGWYDVFPPRKEVVVPAEPGAVLDAINDRAITRLAVVDRPVEHVRLHHQEPAAARDRIASAFAYSPAGRVADADVELAARDRFLVQNTDITLHPERTPKLRHEILGILPPVAPDEDLVIPNPELPPLARRLEISRAREQISPGGLPVESYRRIGVDDALGMLVAPDRSAQRSFAGVSFANPDGAKPLSH